MRELVVLGTSSQVPTRHRNHNGYLLRWDGEGILFDPGEGTQRQMTYAGVSASGITRICITHLHGDHCLGLPGVLQRFALDRVERPVTLYYPASGEEYIERLQHSSVYNAGDVDVVRVPVTDEGVVGEGDGFSIIARRLDHQPDTIGWRIEEPDGLRMDRAELDRLGIHGRAAGLLREQGRLRLESGAIVQLEDVTEPKAGQKAAFVMDTRWCDGAAELAADADLLICEATFLHQDVALAESYGHMTARQAGELAALAGARQLVITHFSQRYPDVTPLLQEAAAAFPHVHAANDLDRVPVPPRRAPSSDG